MKKTNLSPLLLNIDADLKLKFQVICALEKPKRTMTGAIIEFIEEKASKSDIKIQTKKK